MEGEVPVADEVRLWSDELARDPSSLVFLPLAETLRRQGQLDLARKIAIRGLERHPHNPDAHDQLARILADRGDLQAAFDEWDMVLRLVPAHVGALKGMAFIRFQQGRLAEAERLLKQVPGHGDDSDVSAAIGNLRLGVQTPASGSIAIPAAPIDTTDPRQLFANVLGNGQSAILLDRGGLVFGGSYYSAGRDVAQDVGASLSGVSDEANRASRHLTMGAWRSIVFETEAAVVTLAPAPALGALAAGGLLVVVAPPGTPLGLLKRLLERCVAHVSSWLSAGGGGGTGGGRTP
jgi:predicted regulator of Ras-like GTPase activity (Roadblock/LC7/MglB family)